MLLIAYYWCNGKIPRNIDIVKNITRLNEKKLTQVMKFFRTEDGFYIHDRIEQELSKALEIKKKKSEAGKKGMDSRYNRTTNSVITEALTKGITKSNQSPSPSHKIDLEGNFDIKKVIQYGTLLEAEHITKKDINSLAQDFNAWIKKNKIPESPDKAFIAWCKKQAQRRGA